MMNSKLSARALALAVALALSACGGGGGGGDDSSAPVNRAPVANAGSTQSVLTGSTVTLTAAGSTDADGNSLTYGWTLVSKPAGSVAALSSTTLVMPTFTPDAAGDYVFSLVVNDGQIDSATSSVTVTAAVANAAPVANAGAAQSVTTGTLVTLDGSASSDANGDALTYAWTLSSKPAGSAAALPDATSARPTFTADVAGTYVATLSVSDGHLSSTPATVSVKAAAANVAPVANAGTAQNVTTGTLVTLDGSASSDANGDALTYAWTLTSKPAGSAAALSSATTVRPTFTADAGGDYVATLTVRDGALTSASTTVSVRASTPLSGILITSKNLTRFLSPYNLSGDLSVPGGTVLSLESGVILNGNGNRLVVEGTLRAIGTATDRITIKNTKIVPAGKSSGANPSHLIDLAFANITGGTLYAPTGNAIYGTLRLTDSNLNGLSDYLYLWYPGDVVIERNLFQASGGISIGSGGTVSVTNNCFVDWRSAFAVENWANYGATISIKKNSFMTRSVAVRLPTGYTNASLDATQNYWGTQDTAVIQDMIFDRNDDLNSTAVIPYLPILSGHDPQTPCP